MCFRVAAPAGCAPWDAAELRGLVRRHFLPTVYAGVLAAGAPVPVCAACQVAVQRREAFVRRYGARRRVRMRSDLCMRFLLSGGATPRPTAAQLLRVVASLLHRYPSNPLLDCHPAARGVLRLLLARGGLPAMARWGGLEWCAYAAHAHWVLGGQPRYLASRKVARWLRLGLQLYPELMGPPAGLGEACWRCRGTPAPAAGTSYAGAVAGAAGCAALVRDMEAMEEVVQGVTVFCARCCRVSVIAPEYAAPAMPAAGYYVHQWRVFGALRVRAAAWAATL